MMDSFENIVKVGGYIIIFSVFIRLLTKFSTDIPAFFYLLPVLELTNGIIILFERFENIAVSYPLIIALTSFGGLCALAQTKSMIHSSGIPFIPYLIQKKKLRKIGTAINMISVGTSNVRSRKILCIIKLTIKTGLVLLQKDNR